MQDCKGVFILFQGKSLTHLSEGERKCIYIFPGILNRLKLIEGQLFAHWNVACDRAKQECIQQASLGGVLEYFFMLASELKEGWEAIRKCYYGLKTSKSLNTNLPITTQEYLRKLPEYFKSGGLIDSIRNEFSHHHSPDAISDVISSLDQELFHEFFIGEPENNYFHYTTQIRMVAISRVLGVAPNQVVNELITHVIGVPLTGVKAILNDVLVQIFGSVSVAKSNMMIKNIKSEAEMSGDYFFVNTHLVDKSG